MDQQAKLDVYRAQTENVRALRTAMRQVHKSINAALRGRDNAAATAFSKIYALLFCAWAEANFSKVLHTPYGFKLDEIAQVQASRENGIGEAWKKSVELGLRHLDATKRGSFRPNAQQRLESAIHTHVFDPSLLRNKLAHGQWVVALNRANEAISQEITVKIATLDLVVVSGWMRVHELLADLVETLIESPKKAFMRDWYQVVVDLDSEMNAAAARTLADHVVRLQAKDARTGAASKRLRI
ncbi:MAG: hypothetical protein P4L81_07600 [Candidatus Pacebacteria bacterium]|nr:hypothetical protein [Candidatus Paceibacterota bacterium]